MNSLWFSDYLWLYTYIIIYLPHLYNNNVATASLPFYNKQKLLHLTNSYNISIKILCHYEIVFFCYYNSTDFRLPNRLAFFHFHQNFYFQAYIFSLLYKSEYVNICIKFALANCNNTVRNAQKIRHNNENKSQPAGHIVFHNE